MLSTSVFEPPAYLILGPKNNPHTSNLTACYCLHEDRLIRTQKTYGLNHRDTFKFCCLYRCFLNMYLEHLISFSFLSSLPEHGYLIQMNLHTGLF